MKAKLFEDGAWLLKRQACEYSLHYFIKHFWPEVEGQNPFRDNWHIGAVCDHLEAVSRGEIRQLIINIPPRSMKTIATSVMWPAWLWAQPRDPDFPLIGPGVRFMSASYAQRLSENHSLAMRRIIESEKYQAYWGDRVSLAPDQNAKGRFETTARGYRHATSVGGVATGAGGDVILIDDPSNPQEVLSDTQREGIIEWWTQTMSSRMNDPSIGARVIIMQRLHYQDLTGFALAHGGWEILCLPMRYEPDHPYVYQKDARTEDGELLWPARVPGSALDMIESEMGPYVVAGQHQQRPSPREGGMFTRGKVGIVSAAPSQGRKVRAWDLAGSRGKKSPHTAGVLIQRTGNDYFILDAVRQQGNPAEMHKLLHNTATQDGRRVMIDIPQDPGQAGKDQRRIIVGELSGWNVRSSLESGAKEVRAEPFSAQWEGGNVYLVEGRWNKAYLDEHEMFPMGDFSDQVDASSRGFARLTKRRSMAAGGGMVIGT